MRPLIFTAILFLTPIAPAQAQVTCPMGAGKTELTIQRVMMDFGKYTMKADSIAMALQNPPVISNEQIDQATADLEVVAACANAVISGTSADLLPDKASRMTGAVRDQFVASFKQMMGAFKEAVIDYAAALERSNSTQPRDLTESIAKKQIVNDLADQAHKLF